MPDSPMFPGRSGWIISLTEYNESRRAYSERKAHGQMLEAVAVMIGLVQGSMVSEQKPSSRGWWRLTASVFAIAGATIAFGYYLPLRQANQLLEAEFEKARRSETALSQQLNTLRAELTTATEERDALRDAKSKTDAAARDAQAKLQRLTDGLPQAARAAVQANRLRLTSTANSVTLDILDKTWITPGGDALTRNGHRVLCPTLASVTRDVTVYVRTFVSPIPATGESRWAAPGRLAGGVAETLIDRCRLDAKTLRVTTAGTATAGSAGSAASSGEAPLLQLELRLP